MPNNGLVTLQSAHGFDATLERLTTTLEAKGVTIFARIDHAAGAAGVGLPLRPTTVVIFGNPTAGTPLMQAVQTTGIDLPLKILVWEDEGGTVSVTYNDPSWIAGRHGLGASASPDVIGLSTTLDALAKQATAAAPN